MQLFHLSPTCNSHNIARHGLRPEKAQTKKKVVWLFTWSKLSWAIVHTERRHHTAKLTLWTVTVSRQFLRNPRKRLYTSDRPLMATLLCRLSPAQTEKS